MAKYVCPKCGMQYEKPGKCTMCNVKLEEIKTEKHHHMEKQGGHEKHHDHHKMMMADFKKRFIVAIILTVPILALSPLIQEFLGINIEFPYSKYVLFLLSTTVFFYGGLPFLKGISKEVKKQNAWNDDTDCTGDFSSILLQHLPLFYGGQQATTQSQYP